jgi:multicomponent Na+:H+ antiporter subunit B
VPDDGSGSHSLILSSATRVLMPLLLMLSVFLLVRGHNEPGGGFVGGLVASASFVLYTLGHGVRAARGVLRVSPATVAAVGIAVAAISGLPAVLAGEPYMTGIWLADPLPVIGKAGTPLLFDAGVYCVVLGVVLGMVFTLTEH